MATARINSMSEQQLKDLVKVLVPDAYKEIKQLLKGKDEEKRLKILKKAIQQSVSSEANAGEAKASKADKAKAKPSKPSVSKKSPIGKQNPKTTPIPSESAQRYKELNTSNKKDLLPIAKEMDVPRRTLLDKHNLILAIIEKEKSSKKVEEAEEAEDDEEKEEVKEADDDEEVEEKDEEDGEEETKEDEETEDDEEPPFQKLVLADIPYSDKRWKLSLLRQYAEYSGIQNADTLTRIKLLKKFKEMKEFKDDPLNEEKDVQECSAENNFDCGSGNVCAVSEPFGDGNSGVCISENVAENWPSITYKGKKIVGSQVALDKLQEVLSKKVRKNCGEYSREELMEKRLEELRKILKKKGIDASNVESKEDAVGLVCSASKREKRGEQMTCGEFNNFKCGDDAVCDVSTNPGVCLDKKLATGKESMRYKGRQIIGSSEALRVLKQKLAVDLDDNRPSKKIKFSPNDVELKALVKTASKISGKPREYFNDFTSAQLRHFIYDFDIDENKDAELVERIAYRQNIDPENLTSLSIAQLRKRAKLLNNNKLSTDKDRDTLIEGLSAWLDRDPSFFSRWSTEELSQYLEYINNWNLPETREELVQALVDWTGRHRDSFKSWSNRHMSERLEALREEGELKFKKVTQKSNISKSELISAIENLTGQEGSYDGWSKEQLIQRLESLGGVYDEKSGKKKASSKKEATVSKASEPMSDDASDSDESNIGVKRKKQENIGSDDVEKILKDVMTGNKTTVEDFSQVQNAVLKCLGLLEK